MTMVATVGCPGKGEATRSVACYLEKADGVHLRVRVVPRAGTTKVDRLEGDALRVRLAAAPVDGEANAALVEALAGWLGVPKRDVRLVQGDRARQKLVHVAGDPARLAARLEALLAALG